jgi:hypothetical protein
MELHKDVNKLYQIAEILQAHGGSFHQALGLALARADLSNRRKLCEAFECDFERYYDQWSEDYTKPEGV